MGIAEKNPGKGWMGKGKKMDGSCLGNHSFAFLLLHYMYIMSENRHFFNFHYQR